MKLSALRPGTVTRISVGVAAIAVMLLMALDFFFGLVPNPAAQALERRQIAAELLAERVTQIATQSGVPAVNEALHNARLKDRQLLSVGLRRLDGTLQAGAGDHAARWQAPQAGKSRDAGTGSALVIPVRAQGVPWGQLELAFVPIAGTTGLAALLQAHTIWPAVTFGLLIGLLRLYLGRVLQQLDPASVVPERVRTAYNALNESVVMVDVEGRVVLCNTAFQALIAPRTLQLGRRLEDNPWFPRDASFGGLASLPWRQALRDGHISVGARLQLQSGEAREDGEPDPRPRVALVNCTPILDDRERVQGALVVFQDQTDIERANDTLQHTVQELQLAHAQISDQHEEMMRLATLDPLTSCMNRRAFFDAARGQMQRCLFETRAVAVLMVDIDHFKNVNDRYGHSVGDEVIKAVAHLLQTQGREQDLVCRYGGEEFCLLLPESDEAAALAVAERLRGAIDAQAGQHVRDLHLHVTASLGVAVSHRTEENLERLIDRADQALYASKRSGRNRVTLAAPAGAAAPAEAAAA